MIYPSTVLGLGAPFIALMIHALAYRLIPPLKNFPRQRLALLVILAATLLTATEAYYLQVKRKEMVHACVLSLMLGYSYFHFFNMSETARRIRILVEYVAKVSGRGAAYDGGQIYRNRLIRLGETNLIFEQGGKLHTKNSPLLWASYVIVYWRRLFYP